MSEHINIKLSLQIEREKIENSLAEKNLKICDYNIGIIKDEIKHLGEVYLQVDLSLDDIIENKTDDFIKKDN